MVAMVKGSNRWLALLGAAVIFSSAQVLSFNDSSVSEECLVVWSADGWCDDVNNNAECGYDGGDCCSCTCVSAFPDSNFNTSSGVPEDSYGYAYSETCGIVGYACIDPSAPCVDDDDVTAELVQNCYAQSIGDGYCDMNNNKIECGYDGGDCCSCTCESDFPDSVFSTSADSVFSTSSGVPEDSYGYFFLGNCGILGYACIDPSAPCVDDDDVTAEMVQNCEDAQSIGDGYCDLNNNKIECGYDGGDCCSCTCEAAFPDSVFSTSSGVPEDSYGYAYYGICGQDGYACIDPEATCVDDDDYYSSASIIIVHAATYFATIAAVFGAMHVAAAV